MAYPTPTNPRAAKVEAEELRREARALLSRANQLDPPEKSIEEPEASGPAEETQPEEPAEEAEADENPEDKPKEQ